MIRRAVITVCSLLIFTAVFAGNVWETREDAAPRWDVSSPIVWNPDGGSLGLWNQATAVSEVASSFSIWKGVPTATISYIQGSQIVNPSTGLPVDVTSATIAQVLNTDNGQNPIIFDNNLDIFSALGIPLGVIGIGGPLIFDGATIEKAYVMMNGEFFDGNPADIGEYPAGGFRHVLLHEIGHFSGLNHSSVNHEFPAGISGCPPPTVAQLETMKPFSIGAETPGLHHDDRMILSHLYPAATFNTDNARIRGLVMWSDGFTEADGSNVILRPVTADCSDRYELAQSSIAGSNLAEFGGRGMFEFAGLTPGGSYELYQQTILDGGIYQNWDPCCGVDEYWNQDEDYFDPPDDRTVSDAAVAGVAGSTTAGFDILLNNPAGPGVIGSDGADALFLSVLDGSTEFDKTFAADIEFTYNLVETDPGDQLAWVNRYTPGPNQLPLEIQEIALQLEHPLPIVGRPIRLLVYSDPAGTGDIANAALVYTEDTVVPAAPPPPQLDSFKLAAPVSITSGDFYVGAYDLVSDALPAFARHDPYIRGAGYIATNSTVPGDFVAFPAGNFLARAIVTITPPAGSLVLSWGEACNASQNGFQDYAVYEGGVASFGGVLDHAALTCSTERAREWVVPPGSVDRFFLVTTLVTDREGELGTGTGGTSRAPTTTCETTNEDTCP